MQIVSHGGLCCGIFHLYGMSNDPDVSMPSLGGTNQAGMTRGEYALYLIEQFEGNNRGALPRLIEVTLIESQSRWFPFLRENGFHQTMEFRNGNTGNDVTTFHRHPDLTVFEPNARVAALPAMPVPPPPPAAPVAPAQEQLNLPNYLPNDRVPVGTRVQMNDHNTGRNGQFGVVESQRNDILYVRMDDGYQNWWFTFRFRPAPAAVVPPIEVQPDPVQPALQGMPEGWIEDPSDRPLAVGDRVIYHGRLRPTLDRIGWVGTCIVVNEDTHFDVLYDGRRAYGTAVGNISRIIEINPARVEAQIEEEAVLPARVERREVLVEYFANLRNGGLRGPFSAVDEAREAYPRCRSFQRRVLFSDGTFETEEV